MRFHITEHAVERYAKRIAPDLLFDDAYTELAWRAPTSTPTRERGYDGREKRLLGDPRPCVLVCNREAHGIVVVTVLKKEDDPEPEDVELAEEFTREFEPAILAGIEKTIWSAKDSARAGLRENVASLVRNEVSQRLDKFVGAAKRKKQTENAIAAKEKAEHVSKIAVEALRAIKRCGAPARSHEIAADALASIAAIEITHGSKT